MIGFGSANFNQGTFGKGVIQSYGIIASTTLTFGGLIHGATGYMQGTGTMYSRPVFTWAGFSDIGTEQSTISTFGHIAWDSQLVSDATWTNQTID